MAIEPVKIPQNVYVEDRIIGPITLRQLIIVMLSAGISYALWTGIKASTGYASLSLTVICWVPAVIGAAFAFLKIQGISLFRLCLLMIEKTEKPPVRLWAPREGISINLHYFAETKEKEKNVQSPHREKIEELSALLDKGPVLSQAEEKKDAAIVPAEQEQAKPVDPARIAAEPLPAQEGPIDDIVPKPLNPTPKAAPSSAPPLVRDILPPPQHA